jgi:hypothetical membrane protein
VGAAPFAALTLVLWVDGPRFALSAPSLIDDWFGITYGRKAFASLVHALSPSVDYAGRFRPAYTAVWDYAQWHLLGHPSMAAAAPFGFLRIVGFFAAIFILAVWVSGESFRTARPVLWLAPFAVALTPKIAVDVARYGPAEPLMVTGLILGLALIVVGAQRLARSTSKKQLAFGALLLLAGYAVYLFGVYIKEASVCLAVFVPFFVRWLFEERLATVAPATRRRAAALLGLVLSAPLIHVAVEVMIGVAAGNRPYPTPPLSLWTKIFATGLTPLLGQPGVLGTFFWFFAVPATLVAAVSRVRRRVPGAWRTVALLVTGWSMSAFELAQGETHSRYYVAWLVAVAAVGARVLSGTHHRIRLCAAVATVALLPLPAHNAIAAWVRSEQSGTAAVNLSASVLNANCRLFLAGFDVERRVAIPRLLTFAKARPLPTCRAASPVAYALTWVGSGIPPLLARDCRTHWQLVTATRHVNLYRCGTLAPTRVPDQDAASGRPEVKVVELRQPTTEPPPSMLFQANGARGNALGRSR